MKKSIFEKIYSLLSNKSIKRQIIRVVVPALVIPSLIIGGILSFILVKTNYEKMTAQLSSDSYRVRSLLLDCLLDINTLSEDIISDPELIKLLSRRYTPNDNVSYILNSYPRIGNYHDSKSFISEISIYTTNPTISDARYIKGATSDILDNYFSKSKYIGDINWMTTFNDSEGEHTTELTLVRSIPLINSPYEAIFVLSVSNNYLKNRIKNNDFHTSLELDSNPLFFSTTRSEQGHAQPLYINYENQNYTFLGPIEIGNRQVLGHINSLLIPKSDSSIYICTLDFKSLQTLWKLLGISSLIVILPLFIALLGIITYIKALEHRILILRGATHQASLGNYDIINNFEGEDELTDTFHDIQHMIKTVKEKEAHIYEDQLKKKTYEAKQREMEFKLLASQINPHFMYNTLETIRMIALGNRDFQVSNTVSLFGKTLHYVLENTVSSKASIAQELDHVDAYLQIQKLRFDDRFDYSINVPENIDLTSYQILPLLLQPLVENAIIHGLEGIDYKAHIAINMTLSSGKKIIISIIDDGAGIPDDALEKLQNSLISSNPGEANSIAVINIAKRIKLFYGDDYNLEITKNTPSGVKATVCIPLLPFDGN